MKRSRRATEAHARLITFRVHRIYALAESRLCGGESGVTCFRRNIPTPEDFRTELWKKSMKDRP